MEKLKAGIEEANEDVMRAIEARVPLPEFEETVRKLHGLRHKEYLLTKGKAIKEAYKSGGYKNEWARKQSQEKGTDTKF